MASVTDEQPDKKDILSIDSIPMDDHRYNLIKIIMMNRRDFRVLFGIDFANQCGYFIDQGMSDKIHLFSDWVDYPKGDSIESHCYFISEAVFSDDGYHLYMITDFEMITMRSFIPGTPVVQWKAHDGTVLTIAYRCGLLASADQFGEIKIWNARTYQLIHTLKEHEDEVNKVDFNERGTLLVSTCEKKDCIRLWSVTSGKCVRKLVDSAKFVGFIDKSIVTASKSDELKLWNPDTGENFQSVKHSNVKDTGAVFFNHDASLFVCLSTEYFMVYTWPEMTEVCSVDSNYDQWYTVGVSGYFHPDNQDIIVINNAYYNIEEVDDYDDSGDDDGWRSLIRMYNMKTRTWLSPVMKETYGKILISPDRSFFISYNKGEFIETFEVPPLVG